MNTDDQHFTEEPLIKKRGYAEAHDLEEEPYSSSVRKCDDDAEVTEKGNELFRVEGNGASRQTESHMRESTTDNDEESSQSGGGSQSQNDSAQKKLKVTQAQMMGKTAGRWTKEEHKKFVQALKNFGKDWKRVEEFVQTRSGAQIRSHAQKYFIRIQKKLKGNSATYLNQSEDQCNTNKGLELFRQTIQLYEEGVQDDANEDDDDEISCMNSIKRPKHEGSSSLIHTTTTLQQPSGLSNSSHGMSVAANNAIQHLKSLGIDQDVLASQTKALLAKSTERSFESTVHQQDRCRPHLLDERANSSHNLDELTKLFLNTPLYNFGETLLQVDKSFGGSGATGSTSANSSLGNIIFLNNERKQIQGKFVEIVRSKDHILNEIYFNDGIDLFSDGRKYLAMIQEILNDIQKLSQKLTIINQISGLLDPNSSSPQSSLLLERLLILINEVVSLQKVLLDLVSNNEMFNKHVTQQPMQPPSAQILNQVPAQPADIFQSNTSSSLHQQLNQQRDINQNLSLIQMLTQLTAQQAPAPQPQNMNLSALLNSHQGAQQNQAHQFARSLSANQPQMNGAFHTQLNAQANQSAFTSRSNLLDNLSSANASASTLQSNNSRLQQQTFSRLQNVQIVKPMPQNSTPQGVSGQNHQGMTPRE
ncbi:hypothetical protein FGO68_gene4967 [Halteria grandinella]|uniref:Uncharacterized protein n=1 Tax=Halteria grandinella TaxID=5974 RepID=A0A8J8T6E5_HALGN|nr:hypothetical protein FGO68_gene4967 [Halteria grandinella]